MKRSLLVILTLCLLLLCGCGRERTDPNLYQVERDGILYSVDLYQHTISFNGHVCTFDYNGNHFTLTYPDGSTWYRTQYDTFSFGGWSPDYDEDRYAPGDTLLELLEQEQDTGRRERRGNPLLGLILLVAGIFNLAAPETTWRLSYGWRYKDAQPSEAALIMERAGGALAAVIGLFAMLI